ncbi:hypothetical protein AKJ09_09966 [Labilithrix luteola]|uniref:Uncharacterized protein n=1 Tax=Labilithrix luteola TaxID=1391654 RepID=A0A0K1QC52_9BACT|nr:hypothetical protein [Labilithrix luteola]AKV03303.1 hypothetical protein AKJ09_09966 [Labilithrix luteola]
MASQRRALVTSIALTLVSGVRAAAAEPSAVALRLSESAPEGCPKTPSLRERLATHLGRIHEVEAQSEEPAIDLVFRVERKNGLNLGSVRITSAGVSVERSASSTSCEDVYAALSVMAAIAIGEEREAHPLDARGPSEPPGAEPTTEAPRPPTVPPPAERVARVVGPVASPSMAKRIEVGFGAGPEVNGNRGLVLLSTWFAQISVPFGLDPTLRVGLARSTREHVSSPRGGLDIRWSEVTFAGCATLLRQGALRVGPCVNVELGRLEASLLPPLDARQFSYLWLTLGGSVRVAWQPVRQFSIELTSGVRAPLLRKELYFEPYAEPVAYRAPALSPFMAVGIVAHLP